MLKFSTAREKIARHVEYKNMQTNKSIYKDQSGLWWLFNKKDTPKKQCNTRETYSMTEYSSEHPAERYSVPLYSSYPLISILLWSHCVPGNLLLIMNNIMHVVLALIAIKLLD